jgi:hypothetical protein
MTTQKLFVNMSPLFILVLYGKTNTKICFCVRFCHKILKLTYLNWSHKKGNSLKCISATMFATLHRGLVGERGGGVLPLISKSSGPPLPKCLGNCAKKIVFNPTAFWDFYPHSNLLGLHPALSKNRPYEHNYTYRSSY